MANILALDDNLELCKLIRTALERDGHRVETRSSGQELTEALCRWADCILLDVMMPGEDGFAVCRCIRGLTEAPILFLSARTDEAAVLKGLGAQNIGAGKHDRVDAILLVRHRHWPDLWTDRGSSSAVHCTVSGAALHLGRGCGAGRCILHPGLYF